MSLCKMVAMVILHQFLSSGHIMPNVAKQESYLKYVFAFDLSKIGIIE